MSEQKGFSTALSKVNDAYFPMIEQQLTGNGIEMDDYSKQCVMNAISAINNTLDIKGISWNDSQLDQSNITTNLLTVASLKLNPAASPNEVYFQLRSVKIKRKGKDEWKKQIEMGIEGDGNDAILSNFGRGVKEVRKYWQVRSGDTFHYPAYKGLEMSPPEWGPTGKGHVEKIVYPIIKTSGAVEYYIAEREDVIKNLIAHVKNNLMNETFGIAKTRYEATPKQKQDIQEKKDEIIRGIKEKGLDGSLNDAEIQKHISPAWKDEQSKESMIERKMRNNIVKKIPKDFGNAYTGFVYNETSSESENVRKEVNENANGEVIDIQYDDSEPTEETNDGSQEEETQKEGVSTQEEENESEHTRKRFEKMKKESPEQFIEDDVPF
ncbi:hypothetical protein [Virgibacillus sp. CBA3643]|uniref:hypothetical protein n=1 Tax=Virgibacillus sp. CBA3643 TaxID=2942278 RepID=UPI0035A36421